MIAAIRVTLLQSLFLLSCAIGFAGFAVGPASAQDLGGFVIENFATRVTVEPNSDVLIVERIVVDFSEPRRGIYRTIPIRYSDPHGYAYSLDLRLLSVTDDAGREHQTQVTHEGRNVNIRIGDPDRVVQGRQTYLLRYRVREALSRFGEFDEIYWNATGNEWNAPILQSSATVILPSGPGVSLEGVQAAGYTGGFGETGTDVDITHPEPGVVQFRTTRPLAAREGLTVAVGFPKGLVTFPSPAERAGRLASDNWVALLPLAWLVFLFRRYRSQGRDPDPGGAVMVTYEPPAGLSPGALGTLVDEKVDLADISATVVDLAVRRYLTIRVESRDRLFGVWKQEETVFVREPPEGKAPLAPHEQHVMNALFATGDEVATSDLTNKFYTHLPEITRSLYDRLAQEGYFEGSPEKVRNRWLLYGAFAAAGTGAFALAWMAFRGVPPPAIPLVPLATAAVTFGLFFAFSRAMPRRTPKGVAARRWALGFQEFASRVERERLDEAGTLQHDPRHEFETLLPYAMALGVAAAWARKYEGIYARSAPAWYVGTHNGVGFSTQSFERSLSGAMSRTQTTMASSPRSSSGSGGGGFSGGGGGGGGGGSW